MTGFVMQRNPFKFLIPFILKSVFEKKIRKGIKYEVLIKPLNCNEGF